MPLGVPPSGAVSVGQVLGDWQCRAQLGTGSFGIVHVWASLSQPERVVALKKCRLGAEVAVSEKVGLKCWLLVLAFKPLLPRVV